MGRVLQNFVVLFLGSYVSSQAPATWQGGALVNPTPTSWSYSWQSPIAIQRSPSVMKKSAKKSSTYKPMPVFQVPYAPGVREAMTTNKKYTPYVEVKSTFATSSKGKTTSGDRRKVVKVVKKQNVSKKNKQTKTTVPKKVSTNNFSAKKDDRYRKFAVKNKGTLKTGTTQYMQYPSQYQQWQLAQTPVFSNQHFFVRQYPQQYYYTLRQGYPQPGGPAQQPQPGNGEQPPWTYPLQPESQPQQPLQPGNGQQPSYPQPQPQPGYPQPQPQPQPGYPQPQPQPGYPQPQPQPGYPQPQPQPQPGYPQPPPTEGGSEGAPEPPVEEQGGDGDSENPEALLPIDISPPEDVGGEGENGQEQTGAEEGGQSPEEGSDSGGSENQEGGSEAPESENEPGNGNEQQPSTNPNCKAPRGQFASPTACNRFLNCWDDVAVEQECGGNLLFNEERGYCDFPQNVDCGDRVIEKPGAVGESGECPTPYGTYTSSSNCGAFVVCVDSIPNNFVCPAGLAYNSNLGVCDYEYRVDCGGVPLLPAPEEPETSEGGDGGQENGEGSQQGGDGAGQETGEEGQPGGEQQGQEGVGQEGTGQEGVGQEESQPGQQPESPPAGLPAPGYPRFPTNCRNGFVQRMTRDCRTVAACVRGRTKILTCPRGYGFDSRTGHCLHYTKARCG